VQRVVLSLHLLDRQVVDRRPRVLALAGAKVPDLDPVFNVPWVALVLARAPVAPVVALDLAAVPVVVRAGLLEQAAPHLVAAVVLPVVEVNVLHNAEPSVVGATKKSSSPLVSSRINLQQLRFPMAKSLSSVDRRLVI
jgi:hypothetical protein